LSDDYHNTLFFLRCFRARIALRGHLLARTLSYQTLTHHTRSTPPFLPQQHLSWQESGLSEALLLLLQRAAEPQPGGDGAADAAQHDDWPVELAAALCDQVRVRESTGLRLREGLGVCGACARRRARARTRPMSEHFFFARQAEPSSFFFEKGAGR
jgi:hypothetical protein